MSKNGNTSSSSDDDEMSNAAFREACDETFLPQSLFSKSDSSINESTGTDDKDKKLTKPSLRITERFDNFKSFGVSQSFKDHVAKKLDSLLDRNIEDADNSEEVPKKKKKRKKELKNETGIKLLSTSDEIITKIEEPKDEIQRQIKPWKFTRENESKNMIKCKEAAVDSNWILSKIETKSWNERQKGAIFKYKRGSDGALIEQQ